MKIIMQIEKKKLKAHEKSTEKHNNTCKDAKTWWNARKMSEHFTNKNEYERKERWG